jgi:hypothetical protein
MKKFMQIALLIFLCGCDIFSLRQAEEPDKPPLWHNFYYTPELALQNLVYGYEDERNLAKYNDLFTSNFRFYFAPQDINDYNIDITWTRDVESDMLYNLHNLADSIIVDFMEPIPGQDDDLQSTPVKLYRQYSLRVIRNNKVEMTYEGKMEIQMLQESGFWRITRWYDYRSDNPDNPTPQPSWGKLKYDYAV